MKNIIVMLLGLVWLLFPAADGLGEYRWVEVKQAVDGDTIRLVNGELVRYLGIDAPEIDHRGSSADPYGYDALKLNQRLVAGKRIRLQSGRRNKDRYGRILAHPLDLNGELITLRILAQGLAVCYPEASETLGTIQGDLLTAQRQAMQARAGIWSQLMGDQGPYVVNRRTKRFHLNRCPYGRQTARRHQAVLKSRREAHWEGYAPCRHCLGSRIKKGLKRRQ